MLGGHWGTSHVLFCRVDVLCLDGVGGDVTKGLVEILFVENVWPNLRNRK